MNILFSDIRLLFKNKKVVKKGYRQLAKLDKDYEKYIETLGRQFREKIASGKNVSKDEATGVIVESINEFVTVTEETNAKIKDLENEHNLTKEDSQKQKEEYENQLKIFDGKIKELNKNISPMLKEHKLLKKSIDSIKSKIKAYESKKKKVLKAISSGKNIENNKGNEITNSVQSIEQEIYTLNTTLEKEQEAISEIDSKIEPLKEDINKLSFEFAELKKDRKKVEKNNTTKEENIIKSIKDLKKGNNILKAKTSGSYMELGRAILNKTTRYKDLLETKGKIEELNKLKEKLRTNVLEKEGILKSSSFKKIKRIIILFDILVVLLILLFLLLMFF